MMIDIAKSCVIYIVTMRRTFIYHILLYCMKSSPFPPVMKRISLRPISVVAFSFTYLMKPVITSLTD